MIDLKVRLHLKIAAQRSTCLNVGLCHFCSSLREITTWWSTTTRKPSLCLATQRSPSLKKVFFISLFFSFLFCLVLHVNFIYFFFNDFLLCAPPVVYAEVETRIEALRSLLLGKLLQTPSTLHDQKRYIRCEYSKADALHAEFTVGCTEGSSSGGLC